MDAALKKRMKPIRRLFIIGSLAVSAVVGGSLLWNIEREASVAKQMATIDATSSYNKDLLYRRWAASHGGLYVPVTEQTTPNPYLAHVPERDITTPSGKQLTLVNPAYMTRQVHALAQKQYGTKGHITSLNPLRPENGPDDWERAALLAIEAGADEQAAIEIMNGEPYLRFIHPMITEKRCLKCHAGQGYKEGDIRGAISVSVPMVPFDRIKMSNIHALVASHAAMLLLMFAGAVVVYGKFTRDLTRTIAQEKSFLESEERYRRLSDSAFEAVAISKNGRIVDISKQIESIYGWTIEECRNRDVTELIHPDDLEMVSKKIRENAPGPYRHRGIRKDGTVIHLEVRAELIAIGGEPHRLTVIRDISDFTHMQEQLRQAEKMQAIGQLAGGIAHDFNNILGAIIGYTDMAVDDTEPDNPVRHKLEQILKASERAKRLIAQILAFSRRDNAQKQQLYLHPLIKEVLDLLRAVTPSSVSMRTELEKDTKPIAADPAQIHEVLMNLAANAVFSMGEKGVLTVRLLEKKLDRPLTVVAGEIPAGDFAVIEVSDTGQGIDDVTMRRIFDPFFTTKPVGKGTGMGLSVVLGIVQSLSGGVIVESAPGKGAVFKLYIPQTEAEERSPSKTPVRSLPGNEHILFVDDEEMIVRMVRSMLENLGYRITATADSEEALRLFRAAPESFDMMITDQTMPALTGLELAEAVLSIRPTLPVILCTGYSTATNPEDAVQLGIRRFCQKPITRKELTAIIREILDESKSRNQ